MDLRHKPVPPGEHDPQWLENVLNFRVVQLASKMALIVFREVLRPRGLTLREWRILCSLAECGCGNLTTVSSRSSVDPAHVSRLLRSMAAAGLVERGVDPTDRRAAAFSLTGKGREVFDEAWPHARAIARQFHALYEPSELAQLEALLDRAIDEANRRLGGREAGGADD